MKKEIAIRYAQRLHKKYNLGMPVDLDVIAHQYSNLKYKDIPFEVDGVTANLKKSGVVPTIIVNSKMPKKRQRFTLAHEIGHALIPWHVGTIADLTNNPTGADTEYWVMEAEANAFATELLMPSNWVKSLIENECDIGKITDLVVTQADVSAVAATLRIKSMLPPGYVFVIRDPEDIVSYSGRSNGTHAQTANVGGLCDVDQEYPHCQNVSEFETIWETVLWIKMPDSIPLPLHTDRPWREVLDEILSDITNDNDEKKAIRNQMNGVFGYANSAAKSGNYTKETLYSACSQRFAPKPHLQKLTKHRLFPEFLTSKIHDLFSKL